ncbi:MAG: GGDEF domain-containing protein [Ruminococcaceae bacterium]|nr:GGDEF domain-containing protein [Oscillospiraceae bacterium]
MKKYNDNVIKKINDVGFLVLALVMLFAILYFTDALNMPDIYLIDDDVSSFSGGWTWQGDNFQKKYSLPNYFDIEESEPLVIRNTIPDELPHGAKLAFKSYMQSVVAKIDGETVYAVGNDSDRFLGRDFSNFWAVIDIAPEDKGKTVELTLFSNLPASKGYASNAIIASGTSLLAHIFSEKGFGNVLAIFIIVLGMVSIAACILGRLYNQKRRSFLYLGSSAIIIGSWFLGGSGILQFLTKNTFFTSRIMLLMTSLSTISFGLYIRESIPMTKKRAFGNILTLLTVINTAVCMALEYFNILGIRDTLPITLVLMATFFIYNMVVFSIEVFRYNNKKVLSELIGLFIFVAFGAIEIADYFLSDQKGISFYILLGAAIYIVISLFNRYKEYTERRKIKEDKEYFEKMAYTDALTGGGNRAGYFRDLGKITDPEGYYVIQADTDRLKYINDNFGHACGDQAIIDTFEVLCKNFCKIGSVYRVGGDEFSVIVKNTDRDKIDRIIEQVKKDVALVAEERIYDFSVSFGAVMYDSSIDKDINATIVRADHKMYDDKKRLRGTVPQKMPVVS